MKRIQRRQWLASSAFAVAGSASALAAATQTKAAVVDTHLHCFSGVSKRFPYHARAPYRPTAEASPEFLLKCMDGAGVDHAIVVHPEPYQDDHRYLEHCLEVGGSRLKGTCLFFADRPGSVAKMAPLVRRHPSRIVAARLHAYAPGRLPPFGSAELRGLWKTASDLGLAMQLHFEPRYASALEPLIKEFSETTVIIDHLGRPMQGTTKEHDVVVRWSRFPKTILKVSAIPDQNKYPHRELAPILKRLMESFGPDRMIYGGGFNSEATSQSYRSYRERIAELLDGFTAAERARVLGGTAAKLFHFSS